VSFIQKKNSFLVLAYRDYAGRNEAEKEQMMT